MFKISDFVKSSWSFFRVKLVIIGLRHSNHENLILFYLFIFTFYYFLITSLGRYLCKRWRRFILSSLEYLLPKKKMNIALESASTVCYLTNIFTVLLLCFNKIVSFLPHVRLYYRRRTFITIFFFQIGTPLFITFNYSNCLLRQWLWKSSYFTSACKLN